MARPAPCMVSGWFSCACMNEESSRLLISVRRLLLYESMCLDVISAFVAVIVTATVVFVFAALAEFFIMAFQYFTQSVDFIITRNLFISVCWKGRRGAGCRRPASPAGSSHTRAESECISHDGHVTERCIWGFAHMHTLLPVIWSAHAITMSLMISRVV